MATYYVSKSTDNGMVVGSDANDGLSISTPKLTISNAVTTAATGSTIYVNKGSWTTTELGASNYIDINNKTLTILPYVASDNVTLVGTASVPQVRVRVAPSAVETVIGAFVLEGGNLTSTNGVQIDETAGVDTRVTLSGTTIQNQTTAHISDNALRGIVKLYNVTFAGTIRNGYAGAATFCAAAAKTTIVNGLAMNCTFNTAGATCTVIGGTRASTVSTAWTVDVRNVTGTIQTGASCDATSQIIVVAPRSPSPWTIANCNFTVINSVGTGTNTYGIYIRNGTSGDTAKSNSGFCFNNTINWRVLSGYAIGIGDSTTVFDVDSATVYGNKIYGIYSAASTPHGIMIGAVTGGNVYNNEVYGTYVGFLVSINQGASLFNNLAYGCYGPSYYVKGSGGTTRPTVAHNVAVTDSTYVGPVRDFGMYTANIQGATNNTAVLFQNNIGYALNDFAGWASVPASQAATYVGNNYWAAYALPSSVPPFAFAGTATVTFDTFLNPYFRIPTFTALSATSSTVTQTGLSPQYWSVPRSLQGLGQPLVNASSIPINLADARGRPRSQPSTHGPYAPSSGDIR